MSSTALSLESVRALFVGDPATIESNFLDLLPRAENAENKAIYSFVLSKLALAQAMQKRFREANDTLDKCEKAITPVVPLTKACWMLERTRVSHQKGEVDAAQVGYEESYQFAKANGLDYEMLDSAHMVAIVAKETQEKVKWNLLAIDLAKGSSAQGWLGPLYHNLGMAYIDTTQYTESLDAFTQAIDQREKARDTAGLRMARWGYARALRHAGRKEEASTLLRSLKEKCKEMRRSEKFDMPKEMLSLVIDLIDTELAEAEKR